MATKRGGGRAVLGSALSAVIVLAGCTSDPTPPKPEVSVDEAYTAIVNWEVEQTQRVIDEDGDVELPVIYLTAKSGKTVAIGVQAAVVESTADTAVVRFADGITESIDAGLEGEPVKDDGVMIVVSDFAPEQANVEVQITRYKMIGDDATWKLELIASDGGALVTASALIEDSLT